MVEVKADALEQSFEAIENDEDGVAALKAELELLKSKIASGAIAAQRPALEGVKSAEAASFVDQYLRRGIEAGLETKAIGSSSYDRRLCGARADVATRECPDGGRRGVARA